MKTMFLRSHSEIELIERTPCVMALGFFDGVHLGHKQLILKAKKIARLKGLSLAVLTFYPHPKEVLTNTKFQYLISIERKKEILEKLGVDMMYIIHFDRDFASLEPESFVQKYLVYLQAKEIVAGFDFTYGKKGLGNIHTLESHGKGAFQVTVLSKIEQYGKKISSTLIRDILNSGSVEQIATYLGDDYRSKGLITDIDTQFDFTRVIVRGDSSFTMPCYGTYDVEVELDGSVYKGLCYVQRKLDHEELAEIQIPSYINKFVNKELTITWMQKRTVGEIVYEMAR